MNPQIRALKCYPHFADLVVMVMFFSLVSPRVFAVEYQEGQMLVHRFILAGQVFIKQVYLRFHGVRNNKELVRYSKKYIK